MRSIKRQTLESWQGRPLMVEITGHGDVWVWPKGTRQKARIGLLGAGQRAQTPESMRAGAQVVGMTARANRRATT